MKKIIPFLMSVILVVSASACGSDVNGNSSEMPTSGNEEKSESKVENGNKVEEKEIPNLQGTWKQSNSNSDNAYQIAAIDDDTVTIYWYTADDGTTALYWSGTFEAPTSGEEYSWASENYHDITDSAILASSADTKNFNYSNNEISYEVTMSGVTATIKLLKDESVKATTKKGTVSDGNKNDNNSSLSVDFGSSSSESENSSPKQSAQEVSDKLDVQAKVTLDGQVAVFATNNSDTIIDELELQINYIDENGNIIDMDTDGHDMVLPGYTVVSKMDVPSVNFADAQIEYEVSLGDHPRYVNHSEDVIVESNPGNDCVIVKITNNSDVQIREIEYDVVLFKGDDVVTICYPNDIYDVAPGATETEKESVYSVKTYQPLKYGTDYDRIEVYLNQAHTFN